MGDVIVIFRIIPGSMENFDSVRKSLEGLKPNRLEEEPLAFGLKSFKFTKIVPEEEGALGKLEEGLKGIPGVQTVETETVSRSL
jgi:translation elongation factor aEF-1 beta